MNPSNVRFVLLRTHHGKNLGSVARVLANFGYSNLVLAELGAVDWMDVEQTAVQSRHITDGAPRVENLEAAVAGCAWVVGTTMRPRPGHRNLHPQEVAEQVAALSDAHPVAIVFGGERTGLSNHDLLKCHDVSVIPTAPQLPSLNLAQAVLVYAWALFARGRRSMPGAPTLAAPAAGVPAPERATDYDYDRVEAALRAHLSTRDFADPDRPRHGVIDLMQTLKRSGLSPREAKLWEAVLRPGHRRGSA